MSTYQRGSISSGSYVKITSTNNLKDIESAFYNKFVTRVGILGGKTSRTKVITSSKGIRKAGRVSSPMTNAAIGLIHEKGSLSAKIPRRSFLEMPLVLKSKGLLAMKNLIWDVFKGGPETASRLRRAYIELGHTAERIVDAAFQSHGFGRWAPNTSGTVNRKRSSSPLIDSSQLRRSISSDVVTK